MVKEKEKDYAIIKIPRELAEKIDPVLGDLGYQTRSEFVKEAIRHLLRESGTKEYQTFSNVFQGMMDRSMDRYVGKLFGKEGLDKETLDKLLEAAEKAEKEEKKKGSVKG